MIRASLIMISWSFIFSLAMSINKLLPANVSNFIVIAIRSVIGLAVLGPMFWKQHNFSWNLWKTDQPLAHARRLILALIAVFSTYYAYRNLPMAVASGLGMTGPLFTTVLSSIFFRERLTWKRWLLLFIGYAGVLCVIQSMDMNQKVMLSGVMMSLLGNFCGAFSVIQSRKLVQSEPPARLFLYSNFVQGMCFGSLTLLTDSTCSAIPWGAILLIGVLGSLSNVCHVFAVKLASPSFLAPFDYTRLCFAAFWGVIFFDEWPSIQSWIGYGLIIGAVLPLTRMKIKSAKSD